MTASYENDVNMTDASASTGRNTMFTNNESNLFTLTPLSLSCGPDPDSLQSPRISVTCENDPAFNEVAGGEMLRAIYRGLGSSDRFAIKNIWQLQISLIHQPVAGRIRHFEATLEAYRKRPDNPRGLGYALNQAEKTYLQQLVERDSEAQKIAHEILVKLCRYEYIGEGMNHLIGLIPHDLNDNGGAGSMRTKRARGEDDGQEGQPASKRPQF